MKKIMTVLLFLGFCCVSMAQQTQNVPSGFEALDALLKQQGKDLPHEVRRYAWPRKDLQIKIGETVIDTGLAFGSWAAFRRVGATEQLMTMGDLVLLPWEVNPVIRELQMGGIDVLAIHNHLTGEVPEVTYVHFGGMGDAAKLTAALNHALSKTKTPQPSKPASIQLSPVEQDVFDRIQKILSRKGNLSGKILQIGVPRKEDIYEGNEIVPASMGLAIAMNFQIVGERIATTGDFVLIAEEVNPVIHELQAHHIDVTALHSHMLSESPRLFFMHFWGLDTPENVAQGLKAALSKVAIQAE